MIYLALPYSHEDPKVCQARYADACEAYAILTCLEYVVLCPILQSHPASIGFNLPGDWETWEYIDIEYLKACDDVFVLSLDGWEESVGVAAEVAEADRQGKMVVQVSMEDLKEMYKEETGEDWV